MEIGKKLISSALAITTFAWLFGASIVPVASAQTSADLQAQISALLAQIAALQAQLNAGTGTGTSGYQFTRNLTVGSVGTDVKQLQAYLNSKGYTVSLSGAGSVGMESTYFGPNTKAALIKFQAANGISATGYFGPITRAKINSMGGGVVVPPGTPGSSAVVISVDNPAAGTIVTNQSLADLAHFTFNGNYTITGVTFKRLGISADTSLSNVFLFEGDNRLTDAASVSSGGMINFTNPNGLFSVNGVKTVAVKADMAASAGETVGIQLVSYTISGGSPVTVNLSGNLQTVASATLAGVALSSATGAGNSDPGNDLLVWQGTATITTRDVVMKRLALRQIGSINSSDIRNFRLYVDGVLVSTVANLDANGYVTFSGISKNLLTGARTVKVLADVVGGSGRTVQMSLRGSYDITVTDTQYNVNPAVTGSFPFGPSAFTVNAGTISVTKSTDSPNSDIVLNGSDIVLGKWAVKSFGEAVKIETMKFGVYPTTGADATSTLRNARIMINGAQFGSTATLNTTTTGTSFTTNYTVPAGTEVTVELRADVYNNAGGTAFAAGHKLQAVFMAGTTNGIPQVSLTPVNVPSSAVSANQLTIASAGMALAKQSNYANQTTVVPATAFKIAAFNLSAGTAEDVNVNTLTLTYTTSTAIWRLSDMTNVYIKYGSSQTSPKAQASASDAFSVSLTLLKGQSVPVEVYATLGSGIASTAKASTTLAVAGTYAVSGGAASTSAIGQEITAGSGTFTLATHANNPVSALVADNTTVEVVKGKITTLYDSLVITDVTATVASGTAVSSVQLWYDGALVASQPYTDLVFNGLNVSVPANSEKELSLKLVLSTIGVGAGDSGYPITGTLSVTTAKNSSGSAATVSGTASGNTMYAYAAIPVITRLVLPTTILTPSGTNTLAKWSVGTDGSGTIAWKKLLFTVATTSDITTVTSATVWDADTNTQVAGAATSTAGQIAFVADSEQLVSGGKNYILKATVNGGATTGATVATSLARPTTAALGVAYASLASGVTFGWSDSSAVSHSLVTTDWYNDGLVKNLPTDTWNLTK